MVVGTIDPESRDEAYYFFPREELERSLRELIVTLAVGWALVIAVAGVVGTLMARRTLRPVRTAADAARSVAEGLLDTRLPVRSGDEFGEWAASFNEMVAALEQKIRALAEARDREQRFAADVAHDLRTPIAAILTAASHFAEHNAGPEADEVASIVLGAARRLDRLTGELLELHRLEAGHETVHVEPVDIAAAVRRAVLAHGWSDEVAVETGGAVVVDTDRRRLDRILVNLIGNGMTHGGGGVVRVTVARGNDGAWISVIDDGPGIPAGELDHIFDRHYKVSAHRGRPAEGNGSGSGLGLSIARESAELLGGRLVASSAERGGATFSLWLPNRAPAPVPQPAET
jgi:two-component system sensor histidine kinase MtrB